MITIIIRVLQEGSNETVLNAWTSCIVSMIDEIQVHGTYKMKYIRVKKRMGNLIISKFINISIYQKFHLTMVKYEYEK